MGVRVYFSTGLEPEATLGHDHAIGLDPTSLNLKIHHNLGLLGAAPNPLPDKVLTFLLTSLAVWATDKIAPRRQARDAWTRQLNISCPAPGWSEALGEISSLAGFLTGDDWSLEIRERQSSLEIPARPDNSWPPDCVCLFSGGVDSLAGAIDLLEAGNRVLLVSHYDFGQLAGAQNLLTEKLLGRYGSEKIRRWGFRIQFEAPELSLRSRSLLFIALGVAAASVWGRDLPLHVPENGWISLNPPLTGNRLGSYSTRTTHPYFISGLKKFLAALEIKQNLVNPFQFDTKGEVLHRSRNQSLLQALLPYTISCAHPVASRWKKDRQGNCGYCFPCLMRRAALHAAGCDDGREYLYDALKQPEVLASRARGVHLRSLLYLVSQWRRHPKPEQLLWQTGPIPGNSEVKEKLAGVIGRGLEEMSRWIEEKGELLLSGPF
jgi:7-cyano-7-deazaguanine synthase in queuosine biosynthesis